MSDLMGQTLGRGNYRIDGVIGEGGMAVVYRAFQVSMDRDVAIKVITAKIADQPTFAARFGREARLIAGMSHPNILKVYDFDAAGTPIYMVMELIHGESLEKYIRRGRIELTQVGVLTAQIASALAYVHKRGVVHRDLKPNNILIDENNNPYLMDFGIARTIQDSQRLTVDGYLVGTPTYMAPEQWRNEEIDGRTDIYALGIMLYEMITGSLPFRGETPFALMYQHFDSTIPAFLADRPDLPPALDSIIQKATAKLKENRYSSANLLAEDVTAVLAGKQIPAEQEYPPRIEGIPAVVPGKTAVDAKVAATRPSSPTDAPMRARTPTNQYIDVPEKPKRTSGVPRGVIIAGVIAAIALIFGGGGFLLVASRQQPTPTAIAVVPTALSPTIINTTAAPSAVPATTLPPPTQTNIPTTEVPPTTAAPPTPTPLPATSVPTTLAPTNAATLVQVAATSTSSPTVTTPPPTVLPTTAAPRATVASLPTTIVPPATIVPPTAVIAATAQPTPTPTSAALQPGFVVQVFRSGDALTLYLPAVTGGTVSLKGFSIETNTATGEARRKTLEDMPSFRGLPFGNLKTPLCFNLKTSKAGSTLPIDCRRIPTNNLFQQTLTSADAIWYDSVAGEALAVFFSQNGEMVGQCPATSQDCQISVPFGK